jgi:hypothetical protein
MVEQYLNPPQHWNHPTCYFSAQAHFKLVVINNQTAETAALVDFQNTFEFDRLVSEMALALGHEPEGDFAAALQYVMKKFTVPQLLALGLGRSFLRSILASRPGSS